MMIDQFTKWVEMAAIPEQSALLTAKKVAYRQEGTSTFYCNFWVPPGNPH